MGEEIKYNKVMNIQALYPIDDDNLERRSSIYQHEDLLSVMKKGEWCPLVFDVIEGAECGKLHTSKKALRITEGLNYTFPVGNDHFTKDEYYLSQKDQIELRVLPEWFGDGLYEVHERKNVFTNVGNQAVGAHNDVTLRVGKDYVRAKTTLKAVE